MAIIIPSKNIYNKENPKIRDNAINGTNGEFPLTKSVHKELATIEWQPFSVTTSSNETVITPQAPNSGNISNISGNITATNGNVSFDIDINSEQYLDILHGGYLRAVIQIENSFGVGTKVDTNSFYTQPISNKDTEEYFRVYYSNSPTSLSTLANTRIVSPNPFNEPTKNVKINFSFYVSNFTTNALSRFITSVKIQIIGRVLEYPISNHSYGEKTKAITLPTSELSENEFLNLSERTVNLYSRGKETAKILASIGEYYDSVEELAISTKKNLTETSRWVSRTQEGLTGTSKENAEISFSVPSIQDARWINNISYITLEKGEYIFEINYNPNNSYGRVKLNTLTTGDDAQDRYFDLHFHSQQAPQKIAVSLNAQTTVRLHFCTDVKANGNPAFEFSIKVTKNKMTFEIGDKVTPMVRRADGTDTPMSRTTSGTAKQFRVCGIKTYYDGAVWQELTLQEV